MALNQFGLGFTFNATDRASPVFGRIRRNLRGVSGEAEQQNRQMQAMGRAVIGFAATRIIQPFRAAMRESREFGKAISEVSTLVDQAAFPMERMGELTQDLAATYGLDAKEQAAALYQTISAGITDAARATDFLNTANKLAIGGVTDVKTAVDGLTTVVNAYAADNVTAAQAADSFFVAIRAGKTNAEELSGAIGRLAPIASSAKISMDEMLASVAAVTTQGISTRESVSGLKAAISNILKPSSDAEKEAKRLGVAFDAQALRAKGLVGLLGEVMQSSEFTEDSFTRLFGSIEGLNAALALTANEGAKVNEVMDAMANKTGATDAAFEKMSETFDFQMKRFRELRRNMQRMFGESLERLLAPVLRVLVKIAEGIERAFSAMSPEQRDAIVGVVSALAGLVALGGGIMLISGAISQLGVTLGGMATTLALLPLIDGPVLLLLTGMVTGFIAVKKAFDKNVGGMGDAWWKQTDKIKLAIQGVSEVLRTGQLSEDLERQLGGDENRGVMGFVQFVERVSKRFKEFWAGLKRGFDEGVRALSESSAFGSLMEKMQGLFSIFTGEGRDSERALREWGENGASAGRKLASTGEQALAVMNKLVDAGAGLLDIMTSLKDADIGGGIETMVSGFQQLWDVLSAIGSTLRTIWNVISLVIKSLRGLLEGGLTISGSFFEALGSLLVGKPGEALADLGQIRDFAQGGFRGGENDPFAGVREDMDDIAAAWGGQTNFAVEQQQPGTRSRANQLEVAREEIASIAASRMGAVNEHLDRALRQRQQTLARIEHAREKGSEGDVAKLEGIMEMLAERIEKLQAAKQDLRVYIDGEDLQQRIARADEADATRNLDEVPVAGIV